MKTILAFTVVALLLFTVPGATPARAQAPGYWRIANGGYVYYPPRAWSVPPPVPYYSGGYGFGYRPYAWRVLPPYGFGSPYYNGYNDPYYYSYGPGVRDFLRMGGADFYGW